MTVSLRDVAVSVRYGEASFVGESAGYIVLGAADLALRTRQLATVDSVAIGAEGAVTMDGALCSEEEAEVGLRALLGQLLELVRSPCRNLDRVVARRDRMGLSGLVTELEAALVPVNRKAARRTLARLARETQRACARERHYAEVEIVEHVEADIPLATPSPDPARVAVDVAPPPLAPAKEVPGAEPRARISRETWASVATRVGTQTPADVPRVGGDRVVGDGHPAPTTGPRGSVALSMVGGQASVQPVMAAVTEIAPRPSSRAPVLLPTHFHGGWSDGPEEVPYVEPDVFLDDDGLDEEPTHVLSVVSERLELPHRGQTALAPVFEPPPARRRSPARSRRASLPPEVCLIRPSRSAPQRRPSDISELLDRMVVEAQSPDDVYHGLKTLSRVEISPQAPPVGATWLDDGHR